MENKENKKGRPKKLDEDMLLEAVKNYVKKNSTYPQLIKVTKLAQYLQDLGIPVIYQDLNRYKKVKQFIDRYNKEYKKLIFKDSVQIDDNNNTPIYEPIDIEGFFKTNRSEKEIEKSLQLLNTSNEKLTEAYGKAENKILAQSEKIIKQSQELESLKNQLKQKDEEYLKNINELKEKLKISNAKLTKMIKKIALYDEFINRYHYDAIAEYALHLEGKIYNKINIKEELLTPDQYKSGICRLSDIIDKYQDILIEIDNKDNIDIENNIDIKNDIKKNNSTIDTNKEPMDIDLKNMEDSLSKLLD